MSGNMFKVVQANEESRKGKKYKNKNKHTVIERVNMSELSK